MTCDFSIHHMYVVKSVPYNSVYVLYPSHTEDYDQLGPATTATFLVVLSSLVEVADHREQSLVCFLYLRDFSNTKRSWGGLGCMHDCSVVGRSCLVFYRSENGRGWFSVVFSGL